MSEEQFVPCPFRAEMASIVASVQASGECSSRDTAFEALSRLERRALIAGAPDTTLRDIAEARFLIGILRESVRPPKPATPRTILRMRAASAPRRPAVPRLDPVSGPV